MQERQDDEGTYEGAGALAASLMALLVLVAIVALFVLLKFNLFHGGKPPDLPTTAPPTHALVRAA